MTRTASPARGAAHPWRVQAAEGSLSVNTDLRCLRRAFRTDSLPADDPTPRTHVSDRSNPCHHVLSSLP
jgi:hypothetical protein